jgi:ubiquinone/menaquinone biosynthesis C-methylase UbiE
MGIRHVVRNYGEAVTRINREVSGPFETDQTVRLKRQIAALYDAVVTRPVNGAMWNWGLYDQRIDRRIRERIPDYDKYETDGFSEQLYFTAIDAVPLGPDDYRDKTVVEVGCGMGEGLSFLSRLVPARQLIGVDLSATAIERANARLSREGVIYLHGDAERLPFRDGEVDVLLNVESSHTYPNLALFFREVVRVLKPGGYFSHMDLFTRERYALMERLKRELIELEWRHEKDVSAAVQAAINRRMEHESLLRRNYRDRRRRMFVDRILGERGLMAAYGARFAGHEFGPVWRLINRTLLPREEPLRYETYLLNLATRRACLD